MDMRASCPPPKNPISATIQAKGYSVPAERYAGRMSNPGNSGLLAGKKGLVLNVTNKNSIGWAIADTANNHGAEVGVGGQNERLLDGVLKLIEGRAGMRPFTIDFGNDEEYDVLVDQIKKAYG